MNRNVSKDKNNENTTRSNITEKLIKFICKHAPNNHVTPEMLVTTFCIVAMLLIVVDIILAIRYSDNYRLNSW